MEGYTWFGNNRKELHHRARAGSGGCGIFVKDSVLEEYKIVHVDKDREGIISIRFCDRVTEFTFVVYCCYLPPGQSTRGRDAIDYFAYILSDMYLQNDCDMTILAGDINARISNMNDVVPELDKIPSRKNIDIIKNSHGDSFVDFLKDSKLCILNGRVKPDLDDYTFICHQGKSVVDYITIDHNSLEHCSHFEVITMTNCIEKYDLHGLLSEVCKAPDHSLLIAYIQCDMSSHLLNTSQNTAEEDDYSVNETAKCKYRRDNYPDRFMMSEVWKQSIVNLTEFFENRITNQDSVNSAYELFVKTLFNEMDIYLKVPSVSKKTRKKFKYYKPYWCDELTRLWVELRESEKAFKALKGRYNRQNEVYLKFKNCQKQFDKVLRRKEREYNKGVTVTLDEIETNNPRVFWKTIKSLGPRQVKSLPVKVYLNDEGDICTDKDVVLDKWKNDFASLYNKPTEQSPSDNAEHYNLYQLKSDLEDSMCDNNYVTNEYINGPIMFREVEKVISRLKNNKAMGIDMIPNEIIKCDDVKKSLVIFFDKCFNLGLIPTVWLKAIIVPIPKSASKDPCIPLNYRGISLLSCVYKVYSGLINNRIISYLEDLGFFVDEQNGFRKGRSCQDHIFSLTSVIRNRQAQNQSTFTAFVDFQKAFDWVDRDLLFLKLLLNNIDGKTYSAVKSMYSNTTASIKFNDMYTKWFDCSSGVRQGDVLSTTLFSIYINDLAKEINELGLGVPVGDIKLSILLYADDIALITENENDLQSMLDKLNEWCVKWRMKVNETKTNIIHFRNKRCAKTAENFKLGAKTLDIVSNYKYLGIMLNEYLDYTVCAETLSGAAGRALGAVIGKTRHLKELGFKCYEKLYRTGICPVLEYGSEIWGYKIYKCSESIQERAIRYFLGLHRFTPIPALRGEVGWNSTQSHRWINMVRFWNRLVEMDESRLTHKLFKWDLQFVQTGSNWSSELRAILTDINMVHIFDTRSVCNLSDIKQKCYEYDSNKWVVDINQKPKLRTYVTFKNTLSTEAYVTSSMPKYQRSVYAKLRCGVLPIKIETGRYDSIDRENRICEFCTLGEVEDEMHFICNCTLYTTLRLKLFNTVMVEYGNFENLNVKDKFVYLMQNKQKLTAKFSWLAYCKRKEILYNIV